MKEIAEMGLDDEEWKEMFEAKLGDLFRNRYYRVVLDEAHIIKNRNSWSK
jgi:SNF2 family DNA or RNA helicase